MKRKTLAERVEEKRLNESGERGDSSELKTIALDYENCLKTIVYKSDIAMKYFKQLGRVKLI